VFSRQMHSVRPAFRMNTKYKYTALQIYYMCQASRSHQNITKELINKNPGKYEHRQYKTFELEDDANKYADRVSSFLKMNKYKERPSFSMGWGNEYQQNGVFVYYAGDTYNVEVIIAAFEDRGIGHYWSTEETGLECCFCGENLQEKELINTLSMWYGEVYCNKCKKIAGVRHLGREHYDEDTYNEKLDEASSIIRDMNDCVTLNELMEDGAPGGSTSTFLFSRNTLEPTIIMLDGRDQTAWPRLACEKILKINIRQRRGVR